MEKQQSQHESVKPEC